MVERYREYRPTRLTLIAMIILQLKSYKYMDKKTNRDRDPNNNLKHLLKIMRITVFFLFFCIMFSKATTSHSQTFTINMKSTSIREVCKEIENKSDYIFVFSDNSEKQIDKRVKLSADSKNVSEILDIIFFNTNLSYKILDKQVVVYGSKEILRVEETKQTFSIEVQQQPKRQISGRVIDKEGEAIIGANVIEKGSINGTVNGTITDIDGNFSLSVEPDAVLVISFIGYLSQDINTSGRNVFNVILEEDTKALDEVVVVGYGSQKKASVVGAIVSTNAETLAKSGNTGNLANALTGNLAGVATILSTGQPGSNDPTIIIRARGTWNSSDPLILVDGVQRQMNDLDVNEVESVSVLKDASATAVFGSKGSEGVILITTKRGSVGKPKLTVDANAGMKSLSRTPEKMDSYEAMMWRNTAIENELPVTEANWNRYRPMEWVNLYREDNPVRNTLIPNTPYYYRDVFPNTDWANEMLNDFAMTYRVNLNIRGGTDFARYFGSLSYLYDGDLLKSGMDNNQPYTSKFAYERVNFRTNLDFNLTKTTIFRVNLSGYVGTKYSSYTVDTGQSEVIYTPFYTLAPSDHVVMWPDGYWGYTANINRENPVAQINNFGLKKDIRTQVSSDFSLNQNLDFITKGLALNARLSYDTRFNTQGGMPDEMNAARSRYVDPKIIFMNPATESYHDYTEGTDYDKKRMGGGVFPFHPTPVTNYAERFGGLRGDGTDWWGNRIPEPYQRLYYEINANYTHTFADKHDVSALALMNREELVYGGEFPRYREDWVGRVTYAFDNRYSFEANACYNGSERFGSAYRFGFFPSIGLGWTVTNEHFINALNWDWLSLLRMRYSVGQTGNDDYGGSRWAYQATWGTQGGARFGSGGASPYTQYRENNVGNPDLRWEASTKQNFGVELSLLQNLLAVNLEVFRDDRDGIYMSASQRASAVPAYFGANAVPANVGQTETRGYEAEIKLRKNWGDFHPWVNLNFTHAIDKIIYMEDPELLPFYQKNAGYQISQYRTTLVDGFMNNWEDLYGATKLGSNQNVRLPGDYALVDFNGDGVIDSNDNVPYSYPSGRPQNTWNATIGIDYKRWSFMMQFYGVSNQTRSAALTALSGSGEIVFVANRDYWTPENTDASYKAPRYNNTTSNGYWGIYDGSYTRLKAVEIAYNADQFWVKRLGLNSVKFYLNGNNLLLWAKDWPDDRETGSANGYPMYRLTNLGLTINF